jgi:hypothetical protein
MITLLNNKNTPRCRRLNPVSVHLWLAPSNCLHSTGFVGLRDQHNIHKSPPAHRKNFNSNNYHLALSIATLQIVIQIPIAPYQYFTPRR